MEKSKEYIADVVRDDYKKWYDTKIIFNAGTGTGKTTFIFNVLAPYAKECGKKMLYLCNRKPLSEQIKPIADRIGNVDVCTYQKLQENIKRNRNLKTYDYIVADESHYFLADAHFNEYTDLAYDYLVNQSDNVIVFMSATAHVLFDRFIAEGVVKPENLYTIPQTYNHVDKCFMFDKNDLTDVIDNILEYNPDDKILVFVNSIDRLQEMYDIYGNDASYLCSANHKLPYVDYDAIQDKRFAKRILFTTKALDNGIDIVDTDLCHIITELFDLESTLQAIGRKRPIDMLDECKFYFRRFNRISLTRHLESVEKQLHPVNEYLRDGTEFIGNMATNNVDSRKLARNNTIFYTDWKDETKLKINNMALAKYRQDQSIIKRMLDTSYEDVLFEYAGQELKDKLCELKISTISKDRFKEYLETVLGQKLFKDEQNQLKNAFRNLLGTRCRTLGLQTLNGQLQDLGYNYQITSKRELSRQSIFFKKTYWIIEKIK